jgi:FliI/YscN family ATPase
MLTGRILESKGGFLWAQLPQARLGDLCYIQSECKSISNAASMLLPAHVISVTEERALLAPWGSIDGIAGGAEVRYRRERASVEIPHEPLGCVLGADGSIWEQACATTGSQGSKQRVALNQDPPPALRRLPCQTQFYTGISAIDGFCPLACGQRIGIFAGPGCGKSSLMGMLLRHAKADVVVVALIGERGREVGDFLRECLDEESRARAVVVASTSDEVPLRRVLALETAFGIAEQYRDQGKHVLLLVDSLTRAARALRDQALAAGELPSRQGYPPSVFTAIARLCERAGTNAKGAISALFTVLTRSEQQDDALGEEVKSLLDGHLVLDEALAARGHYPAISVNRSISRLSSRLSPPEHVSAANALRAALAQVEKDRDLLLLGGTADAKLAAAMRVEAPLMDLLRQGTHEQRPLQFTQKRMYELGAEYTRACAGKMANAL